MRIIFLGAGALGLLFASKISFMNPECEVSVFVSNRIKNNLKNDGIILETLQSERIHVDNVQIAIDIFSNNEQNKQDKQFIFITSKAYDNENISIVYAHIIEKASGIIILQNGLGNEIPFIKNYPNLPIYRMTTRNGALLLDNSVVKHTGEGITYLGGIQNIIDEDLKLLYTLMNQSQFSIIISKNIEKIVWEKLLINIPINAVAALTKNRNGSLLKDKGLMNIMIKLFEEAIKVAQAEQISMENESDLFQKVIDVLERTSTNRNSMLADIEQGKRTEIDFLNGKIVELGKVHGIDTPINDIIVSLIKGFNLNE